MSCDLWRWTIDCEGRPCPGDCDVCVYEETYTIYEDTGTVSVGGEQ